MSKKHNKQTKMPNCLSVILIIFNGVLCEVSTYTITVSYYHST